MKNSKKKINFLGALAFAFAIAAAFAFTPAEDHSSLTLYGNQNGTWVVASGSHSCITNPSETCTARFDNDDPQTGTMVEEVKGNYIP